MAITGRELIECVKGMTEEERLELVDALKVIRLGSPLDPPSAPVHLTGGIPRMSGYQSYQQMVASLSPEQREAVERDCLC
jgi:hypothetical protein